MGSFSEEQLAKVNGVIVPSKLPEGQPPVKAIKSRLATKSLINARNKCSICGHIAVKAQTIRDHFVICVKRNGNPTGAHWDDEIRYLHRRRQTKRKLNDGEGSHNTSTHPTTKRTAHASRLRSAEQRQERQTQYHARLASVNGVVIPSKLAPGEIPVRRNYEEIRDCKYQCPICGGFFRKGYHVQSHFAPCVEVNGNPTGARWDQACKRVRHRRGVRSRAEGVDRQASSQPQDHQVQDLQTEDYELAEPQFDASVLADLSLDAYQHSEPQAVSSRSNNFEPYDPDLEFLDPQLRFL